MGTVALISQKGGVGKTTIAVNLSYSMARRGWRVLLVDADLQGGVGFSLTERAKTATGYFDFLTEDWICDKGKLADAVIETNLAGLSLLTRGSRDAVDRVLAEPEKNWASLERVSGLNSLMAESDYDLVIYDTPTGISTLGMALSRCVDSLLVPEQPSPLCLRSLPQILRMVASVKSMDEEGDGPKLAGFILSMTDPDDPSNLDDQKDFRDLLPVEMVFETIVPKHKDFREASRMGVPVGMMRERPSASSLIFDQLAAEFEERLELADSDEDENAEIKEYARLVD